MSINSLLNLGREIGGLKHVLRDFPGSLVVKTLPYNVGASPIPGWETKIPCAAQCDKNKCSDYSSFSSSSKPAILCHILCS